MQDMTKQILDMVEVEGILPERVATLLNIPLEMVYEVFNDEDEDIEFECYNEETGYGL